MNEETATTASNNNPAEPETVAQPEDLLLQEEEVADYDSFAPFYEMYYQAQTSDLDFWRQVVADYAEQGDTLELACGTGRITLPLVEAGYHITGLDLSKEMLQLAERKAAILADGLTTPITNYLRWVKGNMTNLPASFSSDETFNLIFIAFNSYLHLKDATERQQCLQSVLNQLKPGGYFVLDIANPRTTSTNFNTLQFAGTAPLPEINATANLFFNSLVHAERTMLSLLFTIYIQGEGTFDTVKAVINYDLIPYATLTDELRAAGFEITTEYGSYQFEPITAENPRMIVICRKPHA